MFFILFVCNSSERCNVRPDIHASLEDCHAGDEAIAYLSGTTITDKHKLEGWWPLLLAFRHDVWLSVWGGNVKTCRADETVFLR